MKRTLVYASILEELRHRIQIGLLRPGDKLPSVKDLAKEFRVAQSSVREALRVLESMKVLRIEHGRGVFVNEDPGLLVDPWGQLDVLEKRSFAALLEARLILEPQLAALAATRASEEEVCAIQATVDEMAARVKAGEDFLEADLAFHDKIALAAANPVLARMVGVVSDLLLDGRRITNNLPGMPERAVRYHSLIAGAIADRNPSQAQLLMFAHIHEVVTTLARSPEWVDFLQTTAQVKPDVVPEETELVRYGDARRSQTKRSIT
jgi:GntR family transcriptional repressor for pyruvate dehydrogenase complex